jgi:predicted dehydrogenase
METKNLMVIGVGFHARRIYIPSLMELSKSLPIKLIIGIDILAQKNTIDEYLKRNNFDLEMVYLDSLDLNLKLTRKSTDKLNSIIEEKKIKGVIISTEPLLHKAYASWALENKLNILMDKPITTRKSLTKLSEAKGLLEDYNQLLEKYENIQKDKKTIFTINTQRRYDRGFQKVIELIREVKHLFNIPITSIQAMYADGTWVMPNEILNQSSHPYLHGYGICSHSGYHILDIIWKFYEAGAIEEKKPDEMQVYASFLTPNGFDMQISEDDYKRYFGSEYVNTELTKKMYKETTNRYGEIDSFSIIRLLKEGENICNFSVNLMHNSFSRRSWSKPNKDLYKGNGRVKHQQFIIQQGPFQSIHIHNYQASDIHDKNNSNEFDIGGNNHFDIYIFRNTDMFGEGEPFYKISSKEIQKEVSGRLTIEMAKDFVILEFVEFVLGKLKKSQIVSSIDTHKIPVRIMSCIYQSNALFLEGKNPLVKNNLC